MMIFQPPSQQIFVNRLPEALIQDLLLWRIFAEKDPFFESNVQFHDGNLQDYNLFLYLYSDFGAGNHIPTPSV